MNKNTLIALKKAVNDFLEINKINSINELIKSPEEISKLIDHTFENSDYKPASKLQKISLVRNNIENELNIILPKSKVRKEYNKKILRKTNKEELTKDDIKKLENYFIKENKRAFNHVDKIRTYRNIILFKLLAGTGQRIQDILNLSVIDVKKQYIFFKQEKTGAEINIENPCAGEIAIYITMQALSDNDYLFASGFNRNPLTRSQAFNIIQIVGALVLGRKLSPHCFRGYVVTQLKKIGYSNKEIKGISGHKSESMVEYYDTGEIGTLKTAKDLLE